MREHDKILDKFQLAGVLISLGIVFGDIGTSPLYVLKAVIGGLPISKAFVLGGLSCVFWTLTFQTTLKYVVFTLEADNKGEGGIFSLYALVRKKSKLLIIPAIIGGSTLLADGIITPPISVTSAIEGLQIMYPKIEVVPIVLLIITVLFVFQQFGTKVIGGSFGVIMFIWFTMLAILGLTNIQTAPEVLKALNPVYAWDLLTQQPGGFWILGAVFLCTTGAEALYSDLGHVGRTNIRVSWAFVKICLLLNYFGQGAWLLSHEGSLLNGKNPFFYIMPEWFLPFGITIATLAAVIASQALISGSFTLVSEAMRLNCWPKISINYPTDSKGQLYVPSLNWILYVGCVLVVLQFKKSEAMEAAYGLAITLTMLMTSILLAIYLRRVRMKKRFVWPIILIFLSIEVCFLIANLQKFEHGGYFTLVISGIIVLVMWVWYKARKVKNKFTEFVSIDKYLTMLSDLCDDTSVPKYASHLVYLSSADRKGEIEMKIMYSIFNKQPKRADIYWFVHVDVLDEPYTKDYVVNVLVPDKVIRIDFKLGFRVEPKINVFVRKVIEDLVKNQEVDVTSRYESLRKHGIVGDFRFVVNKRIFTYDSELNWDERLIMKMYAVLDSFSLSEEKAFSLDTSNVAIEKVPLTPVKTTNTGLKRITQDCN